VRIRRNDYLVASGQKSDPGIRSGDLDFLYVICISTTEWRLRDIFDVLCYYVALPCDLDLWPIDLGGDWWIKFHAFNAHTNFKHPKIIRSWVMFYSIWSHYDHMQRSLRMCRVMWPITGGQK